MQDEIIYTVFVQGARDNDYVVQDVIEVMSTEDSVQFVTLSGGVAVYYKQHIVGYDLNIKEKE